MTTTPTPAKKTVKPWPEANALNGDWPANSNHGRALTCVAFLQAHGFLTEAEAKALRAEIDGRAATTN